MDRTRPVSDEISETIFDRRKRSGNLVEELVDFMKDPEREKIEFRFRESIRSSIEGVGKRYHLDLRYETVKSGTPHALVCRKTDTSYHRAIDQRKKDKKLLSSLMALKKKD